MTESPLWQAWASIQQHWQYVAWRVSIVLLASAAVFYLTTFTHLWAHVSDRPLIYLFIATWLLTVTCSLKGTQQSEAQGTSSDTVHDKGRYPSWFRSLWPVGVLIAVCHFLYLGWIAPHGYLTFRGGRWTNRHASDFQGVLSQSSYLILRSAEVRSLVVVILLISVFLTIHTRLSSQSELKQKEAC